MMNILSLDKTILHRFDLETKKIAEKLLLVERFLDNPVLEPELRKVFEDQKRLLTIDEFSKEMFCAKTGMLLKEYIDILKRPVSVFEDLTNEKKTISKEYVKIVKELTRKKGWTDIILPSLEEVKIYCENCNNFDSDKFMVDEFNQRICLDCSSHQQEIDTGITHKDFSRVNVVGKFVYNRNLHFQDCIKQYQGKQNCNIPPTVFEKLDGKFNAYNLLLDSENKAVRYSRISKQHILMFLKELKLTKHYENANLIYFTLTGKRIDDISHLEQKLTDDFRELVILYDQIYGKGREKELERKNFMNIQYLLFQLLRNHNHPCKIENFTILKTPERKRFHDEICSNLFSKLGWNFTPTF